MIINDERFLRDPSFNAGMLTHAMASALNELCDMAHGEQKKTVQENAVALRLMHAQLGKLLSMLNHRRAA